MKQLDKTTHLQMQTKFAIEKGIAIKPSDIHIASEFIDNKREWYVSLNRPNDNPITIWKSICEPAYWEAIRCKSKSEILLLADQLIEMTFIEPLWPDHNTKSIHLDHYININ